MIKLLDWIFNTTPEPVVELSTQILIDLDTLQRISEDEVVLEYIADMIKDYKELNERII